MVRLAVCAIVQNVTTRLKEWVAFHQIVGVEKFFLYDNDSTDGTAEFAASIPGVTVTDWPGVCKQLSAYGDMVNNHRDEAEWVAFIDADEFLWSPTGLPLPTLLESRYHEQEAVGAVCLLFGTSGLKKIPPLRLDSLLHRAVDDEYRHNHVKAIVRPAKATGAQTPHSFDAATVDENLVPFHGPFAPNPSWEYLRINHYLTGSEPEAKAKSERRRADNGEITGCYDEYVSGVFDTVPDMEICRYLPLLDARLEAL